MGIPFYFAQLVRKHGSQITRRGGQPPPCDWLCFDFNCLIHSAAGAAARAGATDYGAVFAAMRAHTLGIVRRVRPERGVMLCVDGVPPLAKMYQQRKRRYMGVKERRAGARAGWWNPNVVTPGTAFMERLDTELADLCASLRAELGAGVTVDCSSWREDGEGEHKIFERLRGAGVPPGSRVVIHGLDADMIMLSMLHPELEITLMREDDGPGATARPLMWVDIGVLRGLVSAEARGGVLDYVVLCMLAGNDFLPPVSYMSIRNNDVAMLVRRYAEWHGRTSRRLVRGEPDGRGNHVDFEALADFLAGLAADEDALMRAAHERYFSARVPRLQDPSAAAEHRWKHYPVLHKQAELAGMFREPAGWRGVYSEALMDAPAGAVATQYLEGLEWNVRYYLNHRTPPAQWFYEHTHGPTFLDLRNQIVGGGGPARGWETPYTLDGLDITPTLQLACVIPPTDAVLLPPAARRVQADVSLGCVHMFPDDFRVPTYLRALVWECHPRLPPIDLRRVARALAAAG